VVVNPRKDTVSREVLRHPEFEGMVQLGRKRQHFIYTIESIGAYPPDRLLPEAGKVFLKKIRDVRTALSLITPANATGRAGAGRVGR